MTPAPYAQLTPDCIMDAVDATGHRCDGRLLALNSFENRVYQVGQEDGPALIAKFYRPGRWTTAAIEEEHAFAHELAAAEIPVVAPLSINGNTLLEHADYRFALFERHGGRAPELDDPATLEWLGRFIGRIHALGAAKPFQHRLTLDIATWGEAPRDFLLANNFIPQELIANYTAAVNAVLDGVRAAFERAGKVSNIRLHGDCHPGNVLWTDAGPHFVDLDDCCTGPAIQDLWMLLGGDRDEMRRKLTDVLAGYECFMEFDTRELHLIEALRTLRLIHYSAWLARRWDDPAFPAAFPWFGTPHYWQEQIAMLSDQITRMAEPPLWSGNFGNF
ncbi:serine/threonine protein kinase [Andreprevotia chitinilytica]|uniref:serine/threonine protein kinase n=1 Tax=Andreprevotia chitinilytica TaxID=396808 RepID=UPI0005519AF0|nr:serine/threonine protein kinase [Andreprevotia chitinilytica]